MKKLYLPFLFFTITTCLFYSCTNDDDIEPIPEASPLKLSLNIALSGNSSITITDPNTGEELATTKTLFSDFVEFVLLIHKVDDEQFVDFLRATPSIDKEEEVFIWDDIELPAGDYYATVITYTEAKLTSDFKKNLSTKYSEAVCELPNTKVFYKTLIINMDGKRTQTHEIIKLDAAYAGQLNIVFEDLEKVAANSSIEVSVEAKDLPSAFYIKTGETLTTQEHKNYGISKFNNKNTYTFNSSLNEKPVIYFPFYSNTRLDNTPKEKGVIILNSKVNGKLTNTEEYEVPNTKEGDTQGLHLIGFLIYGDSTE